MCSAAGLADPEALFSVKIFEGVFLDIRSEPVRLPPFYMLIPLQIVSRVWLLPRLRSFLPRPHPCICAKADTLERLWHDCTRHLLRKRSPPPVTSVSHEASQSYGPLFPFPEYTILNSLVTSIGVYIGIATLLTVFVFPETMNHSCMQSTIGQMAQLKALIALQETVLDSQPEDLGPGKPLMLKIIGMRSALLAGQKARK